MSFNSSNASLPPPSPASCSNYPSSVIIFLSYCVTNILVLLPLGLLVFYLGAQRWRQQRSTAPSHSDVFTYNMVAMEMIGVVGCGFNCCAHFIDEPWLTIASALTVTATTNGHVPFHILTCVERHLAVVHPVTYLRLRNRGGVKIRNVSIGCVWLLFIGWFVIATLNYSIVPYFCLTAFAMAVVSFCSLSVLCALIRSGPGEEGGDKKRVDQSKKRVFNTIMAIMVALVLRFGGHLIVLSIYISVHVSESVRCVLMVSGVWLCLPSSLVLPLLFLHRAEKLPCCRKTDSGQGSE